MKGRKFIGILLVFLMFVSIFAIVNFTGNAVAYVPSKAITRIAVGTEPYELVYDPQNNYIYEVNEESHNISAISSTTNEVVSVIQLYAKYNYPYSITYDPKNGYIYVANSNANYLTIVSTKTNSIVKNITVGFGQMYALYDPDNNYVYLTGNSGVTALNTSTNQLLNVSAKLSVSDAITYDPHNKYLYVTDKNTKYLAIINTENNTWVKNITLGASGAGYATYDSYNNYVYIPMGKTIWVINATSNTFVGKNITVPESASGMVVDPDNKYLYVVYSTGLFGLNTSTDTVIQNITTYSGEWGGEFAVYDPYNKDIYATYDDEPYNWVDVFQVLNMWAVTFKENGLPSGTTWGLNSSFGSFYNKTTASGGSIVINEVSSNTSYTFNVIGTPWWFNSTKLSVEFNQNSTYTINFIENLSLTVKENGLYPGFSWGASLGKLQNNLLSNSVGFTTKNSR